MKCSNHISLVIKLFKCLFLKIINGLIFGYIYVDYTWQFENAFQNRFLLVSRGPERISGRQQSFKGVEGLKKNCLREYLKYGRFLPVFRGKIKVGDQSSPAEKKGRLLKTDTLIRRERVIRTLQSLMGDNVLTQPKSSDLSSPQAINSDQSLKRINYR